MEWVVAEIVEEIVAEVDEKEQQQAIFVGAPTDFTLKETPCKFDGNGGQKLSVTTSQTFNVVVLSPEDVPGAILKKNVEDATVMELKRWLECRKLNRTGVKADLVERVKAGLRSNLAIDPNVDGGIPYATKSSKRVSVDDILRCEAISIVKDNIPVQFPSSGWRKFPGTNIPEMFNYGSIYMYLVESLSDVMCPGGYADATEKPLRKGEALLGSGFVHNVTDNDEGNFYFLSGHIHRSMKTKEKPQHAMLALSKASGSIQLANCRGCVVEELAICCHIAALLFFLWDHVQKSGHNVATPTSLPCTSLPCTWNKGQKRNKDPKPLHMTSYQTKRKKSKLYHFDPRKPACRGFNQEKVNLFVNEQPRKAMWHDILKAKYEDFDVSADYARYLQTKVDEMRHSLKTYAEHLSGEVGDSVQLPGTEQQSESDIWHNERRVRITASTTNRVYSFGKRMNSGKKPKWEKFIGEKLWHNRDFSPTEDMKYGIKEEPKARVKYSEVMGMEVEESGLWVNKKYPHLGASPDGLNADGGIIEIKCLKVFREQSVEQVLANQGNTPRLNQQCFLIDGDKLYLRRNHPYYYQIQLQLIVSNAPYCDFVLHSPKGNPSVERIFLDEDLAEHIITYTEQFWSRVLIPELYLQRVKRGLLAVDIEICEVDFTIRQ